MYILVVSAASGILIEKVRCMSSWHLGSSYELLASDVSGGKNT